MQTVLSNSSFSICEGDISCVEPFSDAVAVYGRDSVSTIVLSRSLPEIPRKELVKGVRKNHYHGVWHTLLKEKKYSPGLTSVYESDRWRYVGFYYKRDFGSMFLWDKERATGIVVSGPSPSFFWDFRDIAAQEGNMFVKILDGATIGSIPAEKLAKASPSGWTEISGRYNPDDDNPVLVLYYMQE